MSEIVERLRRYRAIEAHRAADEIERLRAENERLLGALKLAVPHLDDNFRFLRDIQAHSGNVTKAHDALTSARAALEEKK